MSENVNKPNHRNKPNQKGDYGFEQLGKILTFFFKKKRYVVQAGPELDMVRPASVSHMLGLRLCATMFS